MNWNSLNHEIIDQPKRIVSTSDTTTLSLASDTWESNLVLVIAVTVTDAREVLVKEEKGSAAGSASPVAGACVSRHVPISRQVSGSKCAAVHAGRTVTRIALARRGHVNDVQTAIPAPRQLRILGQLANWRYWASCIESLVGQLRCGLCAKTYISRSYGIVMRTDKVA